MVYFYDFEEQKQDSKSRLILSLGSNVGDRMANLREAITLLAETFEVMKISSVYASSPVDNTQQAEFLNCCITVDKQKDEAITYYNLCKDVESKIVRLHKAKAKNKNIPQKDVYKGPRLIDIDIIFINMGVVKEDNLSVPHPSYKDRLFVIVPLLEIACDALDSITQRPVTYYLKTNRFSGQHIKKYSDSTAISTAIKIS